MYIALEGPDGGGKGTQRKLLEATLKRQGVPVRTVIEPGGTPVGDLLRTLLLDNKNLRMDPITQALLFFASRAQLVCETVVPALEKGEIVLSERSFYSTFAYQGYGEGIPLETLKQLAEIAVGNVIPDLVILLDISPEKGIARKRGQKALDRFESASLGFHNRVRLGYLELAANDPSRWVLVDADRQVEMIYEEILSIVWERLS